MKVIFGSISYRPGIDSIDEARLKAHQAQLRWLEGLKLSDYKYYRVQQNYNAVWKSALDTTLNHEFLDFSEGIGPAAARNVLLRILYASEADWLVCMDDDRTVYDHYAGYQFLEELSTNPHLTTLAEAGVLVTGVVPQMRAYKKEVASFGKVDRYWMLAKGLLDGCLQVACIPNLVKYGRKPVYFDETNPLTAEFPPEDMQFLIDWSCAQHLHALNMMMIVRDILPLPKRASTVYLGEDRIAVQTAQGAAVVRYIQMMTNNRVHSKSSFTFRKNPFRRTAIPRLTDYTPVPSDFDTYRRYLPSSILETLSVYNESVEKTNREEDVYGTGTDDTDEGSGS